MTIPKRRRSTIVVDGVSYFWTRGRAPENLWVTAQRASGEGSLLRIDIVGIPMPRDVADAIRFALIQGWQAQERGKAFHLGFCSLAGAERFVVRSADAPDYWREVEGRAGG